MRSDMKSRNRRSLSAALGALGIMASLSHNVQALDLPSEQHPALLFSNAEVAVLKDRIQRQPYAQWWQTVLSRAESVPSEFTEERTKARYAKSLAFAYVITDSTDFAQRAADILEDMNFPPRGGDLGEPHNEGEVVALYAVAYDMLHEFLAQSDPAALAEIRTILAEEAERIRKGIVIEEIDLGFLGSLKIRLNATPDPRDLSVIHLDNWHIRAYGGLGLAAFALADHAGVDGGTPQQWADEAFDLVTRSLVHQIEEVDGGYAEGPFYSRYAADVYLPYMFALKRLSGIDLFADERVRLMHDWSVNIRLPNGRRPNIDDGHLDDFYGHYLAAVDEDGGVHRWDWENNDAGLYVREFSEMDAIALYDDAVAAAEPTRGPSIFMPGAGDAVFRSDWSADATYMLLRGEHGRAREQGLGHEHPDETSFIIYAAGEMLALDAGYINFANHHKVNGGSNHNVILVDGEGPPLDTLLGEAVDGGNDAFIEEFFTNDFMDYAEVRAGYADVDFRRRVMFPGKSYFIIGDEIREEASHQYEWRLHGHGGGTSGGTYERTDNLARWTRSQAELIAYLPNRSGRQFAELDDVHSFAYLEEPTHNVLRVLESGDDLEFLAVLFPRSTGAEEPTFSTPPAEGAQAVHVSHGDGVGDDFAWLREAESDTASVSDESGVTFDSDGSFGFVRYSDATTGAGPALAALTVQDATYFAAGKNTVLAASEAVDASLTFATGEVAGFMRGGDSGYEISLDLADSVVAVVFDGETVAGGYDGDVYRMTLSGEGDIAIQTLPFAAAGAGMPDADFDGNGVVDFEDLFAFADAFGLSAEGDRVRYDLDGSGSIDLDDFSLLADDFGKTVSSQ